MMNSKIDITPQDLTITLAILRKHLRPSSQVWVFGSRATGKAKPFSDLDLAIDNGQPLPLAVYTALLSDFEESDLPYKVDVVDWRTINDSFKENIKNDLILISDAM